MAQKPSIPKGTRDFGAAEMARRNYIFDTIRSVFRLYGFRPIETPAMENLSTLMGKYGEEGDKLLFKILNSGDWTRGVDPAMVEAGEAAKLTSKVSEKGLRYDLTVPFARFVVQHRAELQMPFKRYQIQPVWRADRPQKGRYREFYQCDADVVGSDSLLNEIELLSLVDEVFARLGIRITIKLNNRKVLAGIAEHIGEPDKLIDITTAIDKIDKIGMDLTVPFARFVVQHRAELQMPFKRYQIQPVWRADRPQKGRYREFYQCDADVVGSDSLLNEIELLSLVDEVFARLGIRITIKLNNRKVLAGIAEHIGEPDKLIDITTAIDKIDKIGMDAVCAELAERGLRPESIEALRPILAIGGSIDERLDALDTLLAGNATGVLGVAELREVVAGLAATGLRAELDLDVSLARGLNYYTGTIIEVKARDVAIGSITGGGRYDNLTGVFGMPGLSGVGISFGADRIYDVLNALDLYPAEAQNSTRVIFLNLGKAEAAASLRAAMELRAAGVAAEVYPDAAKMKKQMGYADALGIPFVAIIGEEELAEGSVTLKNMTTGEQKRVSAAQLKDALA